MKDTGIVRKMDELGRVVLPVELRNKLGIQYNDRLEVMVDGESILLKKLDEPICSICREVQEAIPFGSGHICRACLNRVQAR